MKVLMKVAIHIALRFVSAAATATAAAGVSKRGLSSGERRLLFRFVCMLIAETALLHLHSSGGRGGIDDFVSVLFFAA